MFTINLNDVAKDSINLVGGKGANLGELLHAQFPVPQGFCITSNAYDAYMESNNFESVIAEYTARISADPSKGSQIAAELMDILRAGTITDDMADEIRQSYYRIGNDVRVAVRSSATAEDLPEASFAGQQETYLNIIGFDDLIVTVKSCFASLWTERAISYRKQTGFDKQKVSLAAVVQQMIESDVSGVLFTANPMNNNINEMAVNASYGLGEAVVSGIVTPDTFIWDRTSKSIKKRVLGSKEISIVYGAGKHTVQRANSEDIRRKYCITEKQIESLASVSGRIEAHYGYPQDIEWAIKDGEIFILQSRGITTLGQLTLPAKNSDRKKQSKMERLIMNNLIEHCPNPLYPLELAPFCTVSNGRADALKALGVDMKGDPLVLQEDGAFVFHVPSIKVMPRALLIPGKIKQFMDFEENIKHTKAAFQNSQKQLSSIEKLVFVLLPTKKLTQYLKELMGIAETLVHFRFYYNIFPNVLVNKLISFSLKKAKLPFNEYDLLSDLHYKTWDMNVELSRLAEIVNKDLLLKNKIIALSANDNLDSRFTAIAREFPAFGELYSRFLMAYGWKSTNSYLAFSATSWHEDKKNLLILLKASLLNPVEAIRSDKYNDICKHITAEFPKRKADKLQKRIRQIRTYHQNREESLYMAEWCYGLSRLILKEITHRFPEIFSSYTDILHLTLDEVYSLDNAIATKGFPEKIAVRKQSRKKNQALWDSMEVQTANAGGDRLKGVSGNFGKVKGTVCVVHDLSEFDKLKPGQILVCKYTDPIWTPLFAIAKAIVSDTGGPLSHSAIVAREYGIPAVLGCGNATKILSDGQEIIVDGDEGEVVVLG